MYHPTRGGVRGGRDQYLQIKFDLGNENYNLMVDFVADKCALKVNIEDILMLGEFKWDDVKVDKHRENYIGHSIMAPVGRWQKGKDLHWYTRDKKSQRANMEAAKEEIKRVKEEEEQAMREALGLAPKRASRPQGSRLDKHEFSELVKRGSTAEDLGAGHAEAARVHGLGFSRAPRAWEDPSTLQRSHEDVLPDRPEVTVREPSAMNATEEDSEDENSWKKRRREEKKREKHERREKHSRDSNDRKKHRKDKERKRHDSD